MKKTTNIIMSLSLILMLSGCEVVKKWFEKRTAEKKEKLVLEETESYDSGSYYTETENSETSKTKTSENKKKQTPKEILKITSAEMFEKEVLENNNPVVVKFKTEWCGACKAMNPVYKELANENPEIKFTKADADKLPKVSGNYNIQGVPAFFFFMEGEKKGEIIGGISKEEFEKKMKKFFTK